MSNVGDPGLEPVGAAAEATGVETETEQVAAGRRREEPVLEDRAVLVGARGVDLPEGAWRRPRPAEIGGNLPGAAAAAADQPPLDQGGNLGECRVRSEQWPSRRVVGGHDEPVAVSHTAGDERASAAAVVDVPTANGIVRSR